MYTQGPQSLSSMTYSVISDEAGRPYHFRMAWNADYVLPEPVMVRVETFEVDAQAPRISIAAAFDSRQQGYAQYYEAAYTLGEDHAFLKHCLRAIESRRKLESDVERQYKVGVLTLGLALGTVAPESNIIDIWKAFRRYSNEVPQPANGSLDFAA